MVSTTKCCAVAAGVLLAGTLLPGSALAETDQVVLPIAGGTATIKPSSLEVTARTADGGQLVLSAPAVAELGPVRKTGRASWSYPERGWQVTASTVDGRLLVSVRSAKDGRITWPVSGTDPAATSLQIPNGEGLSVPVDDPWWARMLGGEDAQVQNTRMPFWGYTVGGRGISYIAASGNDTDLVAKSSNGRLHTETRHQFGQGSAEHTISFALTDASPVASAKDYRRWLITHGGLPTLHDKAAANPDVRRLYGAFHAYTWDKANTPQYVRKLRELGIGRMWLGEDSTRYSEQTVAAAKNAGYLIGPYVSFDNAQDPATADNEGSKWPDELYPKGCVIDADGKPHTGFGGRGCYLSSEALARAEPSRHYLANRLREATANGSNSVFLDVDATSELFTDHSPDHPMTKAKDQANRLARMKQAANQAVVGSEDGAAWANSAITFAHGSATPVPSTWWEFERDKRNWGAWAPQNSPASFFKPVELPADLAKFMFDPKYRVPLYDTVLHGSVISLDRWEISYPKLPDQQKVRAGLAMLYNTPLNYVLNGAETEQQDKDMARLQAFFQPLHEAAAEQPMTEFRWLSADHSVQQTRFGDVLTVTVDFARNHVQANLRGEVSALDL
ncbi:hypothetical protein BC739_006809 [Kutzneria viridogrisea]|uniref:Glycosyl hydrolase family 101 n=1 Tax=Kutzneria viridogrisea TaxID=47990 RepID=A0ABR6BRP3_9PSEU|nr:hypothetical protein [Kutzneria viridogrisea]